MVGDDLVVAMLMDEVGTFVGQGLKSASSSPSIVQVEGRI